MSNASINAAVTHKAELKHLMLEEPQYCLAELFLLMRRYQMAVKVYHFHVCFFPLASHLL